MLGFLIYVIVGSITYLCCKFVLIYSRIWSVDEFKRDQFMELLLFVAVIGIWPLALIVLLCYLLLIGLNKILKTIFSELEDKR